MLSQDDEYIKLLASNRRSEYESNFEGITLPKELFSSLQRIDFTHVLDNVLKYQKNKIAAATILYYKSIKNEIDTLSSSGELKFKALIRGVSLSFEDKNNVCHNLKALLEEDGFDVSAKYVNPKCVCDEAILFINWSRPLAYVVGSDKYKKGEQEFNSFQS